MSTQLTFRMIQILLALLLIVDGVLASDEDAVWEYKRWTCEIDGDEAEERLEYCLRINRPQGDRYATIWFADNRFRRLDDLHIAITDENGNIIKELSKGDLTKQCGFGAGFQVYDEVCNYILESRGRSYPYRIAYRSRSKVKSLFFVNGVRVVRGAPVHTALCSLIVHDEAPVRYKAYALHMNSQEVTGEDGERILIWQADSLSDADDDTLSQIDADHDGTLRMAVDEFEFIGADYQGSRWSGIGKWYLDVLRKKDRIRPRSATNLSEPFGDILRGELDAVTGAYRYVSVSIGVTGWLPRKPQKIVDTRYGDCKDLSLILVNSLREQGVEAYPALILTRNEGTVDPEFPTSNFNHMIAAAVNGPDTVWMDPTCRNCPLGVVPWADQNTEALLITDTGGVLVQTHSWPAESNTRVRRASLYIDRDRRIYLGADLEYHGVSAVYMRDLFGQITTKEREEYFGSLIGSSAASFEIDHSEVYNLENLYEPFRVSLEASSKRPATAIRGTLYIDPCTIDPAFGFDEDDFVRTRSIELQYPYHTVDSVWLSFDAALVLDSVVLPSDTAYKAPPGYFQITSSPADGQPGQYLIVVERAITEYEIDPSDFADLRSLTTLSSDLNPRLAKLYLAK